MRALSVTSRDGIARVVLDLPGEPVNKITRAVREELDTLLTELRDDPSVRAIVLLSGKADTFLAGADIDEFVALHSQAEAEALVRSGQALISRLSLKPVVAAIHGACLGGGLEAALACAYRVATDHPKTSLGLPEVQLGIIPAAGGCQRLPRLIGVRPALDIILAGRTVPAARAFRLGLINELVHPALLEPVAFRAAARLADGWQPQGRRRGMRGWLLEGNPIGRAVVFAAARRQLMKKGGAHYPAPAAALEAVRVGLTRGLSAGLDREAIAFGSLAVGDVSRKLVQIFFDTTALKKDPGVLPPAPEPAAVVRLAVVGSGFMGAAIAGVAAAQAQADVRLRDTDLARVGRGLVTARAALDGRLERRRITRYEYDRLRALLSGGTDWAAFNRADLVIEAVFEDLAVKRDVFRELEAHTPEHCILASNTSTIPIARIAAAVRRPEHVVGMHFFSPVDRMPLLEVIVTDQTAPWVTVSAVAFGRRLGKTAIVVRDRPGFWVNRLLAPYLNEAGLLIAEGVPFDAIDREAVEFGLPVGPVTLMDEIGLDVIHKAADVMHEAYGERLTPSPGVGQLVAAGRLGRKSGAGFFRYKQGRKKGPDPRTKAFFSSGRGDVPAATIRERLIGALLNEAALALQDQVVRSPRDGDLAAVFGFGFPPFRGGPLRHIDDLGADRVVQMLERLADTHGPRFAPAPLLREAAATRQPLRPLAR